MPATMETPFHVPTNLIVPLVSSCPFDYRFLSSFIDVFGMKVEVEFDGALSLPARAKRNFFD
jgi:hypothetical protein